MGGEVLADGVAGVVADDGHGPAALVRRGDEVGGSWCWLGCGHGERFEAGQLALR
jgi:D-arabinose 1-dehydrogenase-like Zn-dependent alcohol dehydrogenase